VVHDSWPAELDFAQLADRVDRRTMKHEIERNWRQTDEMEQVGVPQTDFVL
jgi:hypothetical protein